MKSVGNDAGNIQAALKHGGHLVPGLKHLTAVNTFKKEAFEDNFGPVYGCLRGWNT